MYSCSRTDAKLTRIPIIIYYGDNIPKEPSKNFGEDNWRVRLAMAKLWTETINRQGGDATLVHLPDIGIRDNTHFPFADLKNDCRPDGRIPRTEGAALELSHCIQRISRFPTASTSG